jgi:nucleoside 2-deoxyribosyltransferase
MIVELDATPTEHCRATDTGTACDVGYMGQTQPHTIENGEVVHRHSNYRWIDAPGTMTVQARRVRRGDYVKDEYLIGTVCSVMLMDGASPMVRIETTNTYNNVMYFGFVEGVTIDAD